MECGSFTQNKVQVFSHPFPFRKITNLGFLISKPEMQIFENTTPDQKSVFNWFLGSSRPYFVFFTVNFGISRSHTFVYRIWNKQLQLNCTFTFKCSMMSKNLCYGKMWNGVQFVLINCKSDCQKRTRYFLCLRTPSKNPKLHILYYQSYILCLEHCIKWS